MRLATGISALLLLAVGGGAMWALWRSADEGGGADRPIPWGLVIAALVLVALLILAALRLDRASIRGREAVWGLCYIVLFCAAGALAFGIAHNVLELLSPYSDLPFAAAWIWTTAMLFVIGTLLPRDPRASRPRAVRLPEAYPLLAFVSAAAWWLVYLVAPRHDFVPWFCFIGVLVTLAGAWGAGSPTVPGSTGVPPADSERPR